MVGLHQADQPVAGLALVGTGPRPVDVQEGLPYRRGHLAAVATDVDVGVPSRVTEQLPHLVGVRSDPVLHVSHAVLRGAGAPGALAARWVDATPLNMPLPERAGVPSTLTTRATSAGDSRDDDAIE